MADPEKESFVWRGIHGVAVALVLGFFLFSLRSILNPFPLFLLLVLPISPYAGTRYRLLVVTAWGLLTLVCLLDTTGFLLAPFFLALVLAYILHPAVERIEGRRRRISRSCCAWRWSAMRTRVFFGEVRARWWTPRASGSAAAIEIFLRFSVQLLLGGWQQTCWSAPQVQLQKHG